MTELSTRAQIVENADALFYEAGFEATSFADIAQALGISRGNFYYHFKTKDEILDAVIRRRLALTRSLLADWEAEHQAPAERIIAFINILIANRAKIMAFGCPVGTLSTELAKLDHAAQSRAAEIFGLFRDWLAGQFRLAGQEAGAKGVGAEALALHLLARVQGVAVLANAFRDEAFLCSEVAALERWVRALPALAH